jgi:hypothetical protein
MIKFSEWLKESYYGQIVNTNYANDVYLQTRVKSARVEKEADVQMSGDKADCNFRKKRCHKINK